MPQGQISCLLLIAAKVIWQIRCEHLVSVVVKKEVIGEFQQEIQWQPIRMFALLKMLCVLPFGSSV